MKKIICGRGPAAHGQTAIVAFMILVGGCAPDGLDEEQESTAPVESATQDIINGSIPAANDALAAAVVVLNSSFSVTTASCTGTLLNNRWILTASHCIGSPSGKFSTLACPRNVIEAYCGRTDYAFKHPTFDVALLHLESNVGPAGLYVPIAGGTRSEGTVVRAYGFGRLTATGSSGTLRFANLTISDDGGSSSRFSYGRNSLQQITNHGDSGGPSFHNGEIVGVHEGGNGNNGVGVTEAWDTKSTFFDDWVYETMSTWAKPRLGGQGRGVASAARDASSTHVFWLGQDGAIGSNVGYEGRFGGSGFPITAPSQTRADSPVAAIARHGNRLDTFWVGPNGAIGSTAWEGGVNGNAWATPFPISSSYAARTGSSVYAASRHSNRLDVFWVGNDRAVGTSWWQGGLNGNGWATPFAATPPYATRSDSPVVAVSRLPTALDIFYVGSDGAIGTNWSYNGGPWATPQGLTPPNQVRAGSQLAVVSRGYGYIDLYWIGPDGSIRTIYWNGSWSGVVVLVGANAARNDSSITAVSRHPERLDVFWIGPDSRIGSTSWEWGVNGNYWALAYPVTSAVYTAGAGSSLAAVSSHRYRTDLFWVDPQKRVRASGWIVGNANNEWSTPQALSPVNGSR